MEEPVLTPEMLDDPQVLAQLTPESRAWIEGNPELARFLVERDAESRQAQVSSTPSASR